MKAYTKPGISIMKLLPEERIAANFTWVWDGETPTEDQVYAAYLQYLENHMIPFSEFRCGYSVAS